MESLVLLNQATHVLCPYKVGRAVAYVSNLEAAFVDGDRGKGRLPYRTVLFPSPYCNLVHLAYCSDKVPREVLAQEAQRQFCGDGAAALRGELHSVSDSEESTLSSASILSSYG